jgi:hypothetical protein
MSRHERVINKPLRKGETSDINVSEIEDVVDLHVIWWMSREKEKEKERSKEGAVYTGKVCLEGGEAADM